ncbi:unnamed protein product, partial [Citrullus colocynthis]
TSHQNLDNANEMLELLNDLTSGGNIEAEHCGDGNYIEGQRVSDAPRCQVLPDNLQYVPFGRVCANRSEYTFWDGVHPTQVGYESLASRSFMAQFPNDTYPLDINQLVHLNLT